MSVKKILMTADTLGGVWNYSIELIKALEQYDVEVVLAAMGAKLNSSQQKQLMKLENIILSESDYKLEWMKDPWQDVEESGNWLMELELKYSPDIIHLNNYSHALLNWNVPVLVVGHSCVYSWYADVKQSEPGDEWNLYKEKVKLSLRKADCVVTPSNAMMNALSYHYGQFNGKVIYNGRNPEQYKPAKKEKFILSAGRVWDEAKNISAITSTAPKLNYPVYVAGDNHDPYNENQQIENVNYLGILEEKVLADLYSRASVYAFPAKYEPFGLSILEAALSGCALVIGDIESLKEIWQTNAIYVDPFDHAELVYTLNKVSKDESYQKQLGSLAVKRALEFSINKMSNEYYSLYNKMIKRKLHSIEKEKL